MGHGISQRLVVVFVLAGHEVVPIWDSGGVFGIVFINLELFHFYFFPFLTVCIVFYCLYLFVYRYHCLSTACPDIGKALVHNLSTSCPKIEQLDTASFKRIVGRGIDDIFPMVEFLDASMIGGFGTNLGTLHNFIPIDKEFRFKVVIVPELEQGHI